MRRLSNSCNFDGIQLIDGDDTGSRKAESSEMLYERCFFSDGLLRAVFEPIGDPNPRY